MDEIFLKTGDVQIIKIKLVIYSQTESQLSCIILELQGNKKLKDVGQFLYHDQKINFNDFVFTLRPVVRKNNLMSRGKRTSNIHKMNQQHVQPNLKNIIVDNILTVGQIKNALHIDENRMHLLMMYSRKELEAIVEGMGENAEQFAKYNRKTTLAPTYRNSATSCLIF